MATEVSSYHRRDSSLSTSGGSEHSGVDLTTMEALFADDLSNDGDHSTKTRNFVGEMTILATNSPEIKALNLVPRIRPQFPNHLVTSHRRSNSGSSISSCSSLSSYTNSSRKRSVLPNLESMEEESVTGESKSQFKTDITTMDTSSTDELIRSFQGLQAAAAPKRSKLQYRVNTQQNNKEAMDYNKKRKNGISSFHRAPKIHHPQRPPKCHRVHLRKNNTMHRRGSFDLLPTPTELIYSTNPFEPDNDVPALRLEGRKSKSMLKRRAKRVQPEGTTSSTSNSFRSKGPYHH
jgi:hypothetical protein